MKENGKKGFTLVEVIVAMVILAILLAIAVPTAMRYMRLAEFRKNESNAKTAYLAAESMLTWYRASGSWEEFQREVKDNGTLNTTFEAGDEREGRIYAVTLHNSASAKDDGWLVERLIADSALDGNTLEAAIAIEIDIETGQVYSAFYGTRCSGLTYEEPAQEDVLSISAAGDNRAYQNRREVLLGYYSVEDLAHVVELKPVRLKVTNVNLVNSETLCLNWSGNSRHDSLDVIYDITFYQTAEGGTNADTALFTLSVNRLALRSAGSGEFAALELREPNPADPGAPVSYGTWNFPLSYQDGRFSLVLDAMMSADLLKSIEAKSKAAEELTGFLQNYSTSITRLAQARTGGAAVPALQGLAAPQDIYAVVSIKPGTNAQGDMTEYQAGTPARSNTENTLFASGTKIETEDKDGQQQPVLKAGINRYRHLSNIRYYTEQAAEDTGGRAVFALTARDMDWLSAGTGLYGLTAGSPAGPDGAALAVPAWQSASLGTVDFPSIALLAEGQTLTGDTSAIFGSGTTALVLNLRLGSGSMPGDTWVGKLYDSPEEEDYTRYVGLFCEIEGTVRNIAFSNPRLCLYTGTDSAKQAADFARLYGAGILCGRSEGTLTDIEVRSSGADETKTALVSVHLPDRESAGAGARDRQPAGIGGLVGVLAETTPDGTLTELTDAVLNRLTMAGRVEGTLPKPASVSGTRILDEVQEAAVRYAYGIGGIFGYGFLGKSGADANVMLENCQNHAQINGNLFVGGIGGRLTGVYEQKDDTNAQAKYITVKDCFSDGLILCTTGHEDQKRELEGRYFGGLLGFGERIWIAESASATGRASNFSYTKENDYDKLQGQYVGGIIGYGTACHVSGCSTQRGGYILGSDYVGGIAGGLANVVQDVIEGSVEEGGIQVTTNAGYVIGNNYVGGIVGKNEGDNSAAGDIKTVIQNCINNGVAAGYGRYIGGIVGYNGVNGQLVDCASYLSDYSGTVFDRIVNDWKTTGDCVGGLAGYNNGEIVFEKGENITVKSVSSIVVGRNYVGGMIGFNDEEGTLSVQYTLIGGRIYGYGDGVGGCIGLNASQEILTQKLPIRPNSVTGRYYVGGVIGANVVDLRAEDGQTEVTAAGLEANNGLGSINGTAFVGGLIGYHRTYTQAQLSEQLQETGQDTMLDYLLLAYDTPEAGYLALLPGLTASNLPQPVMESENKVCLLLTRDGDSDGEPVLANSIPIRALAYSGGLIGSSEQQSRLVLKDCKNTGSISRLPLGAEATKEQKDLAENGISLREYLVYAGLPKEEAAKLEDMKIYLVGGMISANLQNQVIDHCANTGSMTGFVGLGGIVGFNGGMVTRCELQDNFGSADLDYLGGIAGLNVCLAEKVTAPMDVYTDFASGLIESCLTWAGSNVSGRSYVGGIAGYNMAGATLKNNKNNANITAAGDYAGGIAGGNAGKIEITADDSDTSRTIRATGSGETGGTGIGGIVGWNRAGGQIVVKENGGSDVVAVNENTNIIGRQKVGGIVGLHEGVLKMEGSGRIVCSARQIRALSGYVGGIAGESNGSIASVYNKCEEVTADRGPAGGIVAVNQPGCELSACISAGGTVRSNQGYAGGIAAKNYGTITKCQVGDENFGLTIQSQGTEQEGDVRAIGAICALNAAGGVVEQSSLQTTNSQVRLSGASDYVGGAVGLNQGILRDMKIEKMPEITITTQALTVGAAAGRNENAAQGTAGNSGIISAVTVSGVTFENFNNYRYLGGIAGQNGENARAESCSFTEGTIKEAGSSAVGACYGGIAGENRGTLAGCEVQTIRMEVNGIYTATSTSTAEEKERQASHVGGVAGKNEETGVITDCLLKNDTQNPSHIRVGSGMAGGIAGYNKGQIELSGDAVTESLMAAGNGARVQTMPELLEKAGKQGLSGDAQMVIYASGNCLNELKYEDKVTEVIANRTLHLVMSTNGNIGGITAYNAPSGRVDYCATGNWYLNNQSSAIGVGTGGIIGMNESDHDLSFLVNQAFVGRELSKGSTNRFAGGIVGNQNNSTIEGWKIRNCLNYGTVYGFNTHYSGGILGQWTGTGGTVESCYNYGILQTTHVEGWLGAAGGIVAQLYHANENHTYNIISCRNYGSIYGRNKTDTEKCANDSAGILGNVTAYDAAAQGNGQHFTIQVLDCVNEPGVEIYSQSMASGIVGFFSCDHPGKNGDPIPNAVWNIDLRIERCRNFASVLRGGSNKFSAGILGDKYDLDSGHTILQDCYSITRKDEFYHDPGYPIISYRNGNSKPDLIGGTDRGYGRCNYFLGDSETNGWNANSFRFENNAVATFDGLTNNGSDATRAFTGLVHSLTKDGKRYFIFLKDKTETTKKNQLVIVNDETVRLNNQDVGFVLFTVDVSKASRYGTIASICGKDSGFDEYVREAYRRIEGPYETGPTGSRMAKPSSVTLDRNGSQIRLEVTPAKDSDPFRYIAELYIVNGDQEELLVSDIEFYSETYSLTLSKEDAARPGILVAKVRACSMYDDIQPSEEAASTDSVDNKEMLPVPDLRIELASDGGTYSYRLRLLNAVDFDGIPDYYISVQPKSGLELQLVPGADGLLMWRSDPTLTASLSSSASLDQLLVQAVAMGANPFQDSAQVSVPVYLPGYTPSVRLGTKPAAGVAQLTCDVTGTNLSDLRIGVTLETGEGNITTPPVYRAELVGTWRAGTPDEREDVTFVSQDILTASKGKASATFANLPETLSEASDLYIRVWYVNSGLGPVYSWYGAENDGPGNASFRMLDLETGDWTYGESVVLSDPTFADYRQNYPTNGGGLFTWLPAPSPMAAAGSLTPILTQDNRLQYEFKWDETSYAPGQRYSVTLTGIRDDGTRVAIATSQTVDGNSLTADAENWNYRQVELSVTRIGDAGAGRVGLTSVETYAVRQRLPQPAQPAVKNTQPDELYYTVTWSPVTPEAVGNQQGCTGYQIYVRPYDPAVSGWGTPVKMGDPIPAGQPAYEKNDVNLEPYEGSRIQIYVVAEAADTDPAYVDSVDGVTFELTVPSRIEKPVVNWEKSWNYERNNPVSMDAFRENGLQVKVTRPLTAPPPSGESSYLLKGYVFDTEAAAQAAIAAWESGTEPADAIAFYPFAEAGTASPPVAMDPVSESVSGHTLNDLSPQYAGKWIVFGTRISSGGGQVSSLWTANTDVWQLPFVKLEMPTVALATQEREVLVETKLNPDLPPQEETWTANRRVLSWSNTELADSAFMELTRSDGSAAQFRIVETADSVQIFRNNPDNNTWEAIPPQTDGNGNEFFLLSGYVMKADGSYQNSGVTNLYTLECAAQLEVRQDGAGLIYTLVLPDAESLKPASSNVSIDDSSLRPTKSVKIWCDVAANAPDGSGQSDAYVASDIKEITFGN